MKLSYSAGNTQELLERLFAINRSLTGPGVRETLAVINEELGGILTVHEIPSGTKAFDWTVPPEWRFHRARLTHESGHVVFDTDDGDSALHVVGYSAPRKWSFTLETSERRRSPSNLYLGPANNRTAIPYVTSYYPDPPTSGICLSREQFEELDRGEYTVEVESEFLPNGSLTLADAVIPGELQDEVVLGSYTCHPAGLANNETSGLVVLTEVVKWWRSKPRRHTLRVLLAPETIGPLTYMSRRRSLLPYLQKHVKAGFTLTCMGGDGNFTVQRGRKPSYASRIAEAVIRPQSALPWSARVSDERQWCAPGIDLPWATIIKTRPIDPGYANRYHTSADDLSYVTAEQLDDSARRICNILGAIEGDRKWRSTVLGEPQLGKRGLYPTLSKVGSSNKAREILAVLSWCDETSALDIAEGAGIPIARVQWRIDELREHGLVEEA